MTSGGQDPDERARVTLAATMYYLQGETMEAVAGRLGTSRSSVSRMLKEARAQGIVQITVTDRAQHSPEGSALREIFGVEAHVVPVRVTSSPMARLDSVARAAAQLVSAWMTDGAVLGIAWGNTTSAVVPHLPSHPLRGAVVVQLNGTATASSTGLTDANQLLSRAAEAFNAEIQPFPTPAFFDYAETKQAMWRERAVRRIVELQQRADIAVFGVGVPGGEIPSHLYVGDFLTACDVRELKSQRVVGDICTVFYREDGSWEDIGINARASGPSALDLAAIPRRVCVVAGLAKVRGTLGALRSGAITDLVVDDLTARALLQRVRPGR